jgi:membrane-associated phospholipid phosphatase
MDFKITLVQSVVLLVILIATEPFYHQPLFDASIPIIVELQKNATPDQIAFWKLVSDVGASYLTVGVLVLSYLFTERSRAFYYKSVFSMIMFVMCIGKLAYHSPRPYMVSDEVQVFGCSTEFGHPSGHSINSMTFCIALLLDYLATYPDAPQENKLIATAVAFITPLLVGYSRLFNGDHSMDQILYGWLLGLWIALTCHSLLRDGIFEHIDNLVYKKLTYTQQALTELFWWAVILFTAALGIMIYVYYVVNSSFIVPQDWETRLEAKCHLTISFMSFSNASLIEGGVVALIFGAYQGALALAQSPYVL